MNVDDAIRRYHEAIYDTDRDRALSVVREAVDEGISPEDVLFRIVLPAMDRMVKGVSEGGEFSLAQHFVTARIAETVTEEMLAKFTQATRFTGRIVIGTARGDFHTLGKRIVGGCLKARMIEVIDLGTNLPAEAFVDGALAHGARVIGISALMVHTATGEDGCRKVRRILKERGLEGRMRVVVGGAPFRFHPELFRTVGADAWAENALLAGGVVERLLKEVAES